MKGHAVAKLHARSNGCVDVGLITVGVALVHGLHVDLFAGVLVRRAGNVRVGGVVQGMDRQTILGADVARLDDVLVRIDAGFPEPDLGGLGDTTTRT